MDFTYKKVGDIKVLYVMAAEVEYGRHLESVITPLFTGVGPVESAVVITHALARLDEQSDLPHLVVSLGSAGSCKLKQTEIYQATSVSYRDMDASPLGFEKGVTPLLDHPAKLQLTHRVSGLPEASLSTGANVVSGDAYAAIDADMVDMETFAILRACQRFDLSLIALRGISDGVEELAHMNDWTQYLHIVDAKLAKAVELLEHAIDAKDFV